MTVTFAVSPEKNAELRRQMAALGVREEDLEERFVRSSGKGGQHVNKSSTCVQLKHRPSGIEVTCSEGRSQSLNRFFARRQLLERLAEAQGVKTAKAQALERVRRQKARRGRRAGKKYEGQGVTAMGQDVERTELFARLRAATLQAATEDDLPDFLAARLLAIADAPANHADATAEIEVLLEMLPLYDTYGQTGYIGMGVNNLILEGAIKRVEAKKKS